jgi:membrane associated rhomboid family serine protease
MPAGTFRAMTRIDPARPREPLFNMPAGVTGLLVAMAVIHLLRVLVLSPAQDDQILLLFSFIPIRYSALAAEYGFPGGGWAEAWSPVTYGLLHGSLPHILFNSVWLAAFGSALARRFGSARFLVFSALATAAGAGAHYLVHSGDMIPVVGASAAVSGHMAAVSRFMFQASGPLRTNRRDAMVWQAEAVPLGRIWRDRRIVVFLAVWLGLNLLVGFLPGLFAGDGDASIAWEAHIGGFLFGLVAFSWFDPPEDVRRRRAIEALEASERRFD